MQITTASTLHFWSICSIWENAFPPYRCANAAAPTDRGRTRRPNPTPAGVPGQRREFDRPCRTRSELYVPSASWSSHGSQPIRIPATAVVVVTIVARRCLPTATLAGLPTMDQPSPYASRSRRYPALRRSPRLARRSRRVVPWNAADGRWRGRSRRSTPMAIRASAPSFSIACRLFASSVTSASASITSICSRPRSAGSSSATRQAF